MLRYVWNLGDNRIIPSTARRRGNIQTLSSVNAWVDTSSTIWISRLLQHWKPLQYFLNEL